MLYLETAYVNFSTSLALDSVLMIGLLHTIWNFYLKNLKGTDGYLLCITVYAYWKVKLLNHQGFKIYPRIIFNG